MSVEHGIRYEYRDGRVFVAPVATEAAARGIVASCQRGFEPRPARVMVRDVSEWREVEETT